MSSKITRGGHPFRGTPSRQNVVPSEIKVGQLVAIYPPDGTYHEVLVGGIGSMNTQYFRLLSSGDDECFHTYNADSLIDILREAPRSEPKNGLAVDSAGEVWVRVREGVYVPSGTSAFIFKLTHGGGASGSSWEDIVAGYNAVPLEGWEG